MISKEEKELIENFEIIKKLLKEKRKQEIKKS